MRGSLICLDLCSVCNGDYKPRLLIPKFTRSPLSYAGSGGPNRISIPQVTLITSKEPDWPIKRTVDKWQKEQDDRFGSDSQLMGKDA